MSSIVSTSLPPPPGNIDLHDASDPEFSGTKLMICAIITLCLALIFLSLLRLNERWQWWTNPNPNPSALSQEGAFTTNPILRRMRMAALMNEARRRGDENTMNHGRLSSGGAQPDLESNLGPLTREGYGCPSTTCRGLDRASIDALPTFCAGSSGDDDAELCCAVCLCEFQAEEKGRILPLCLHRFHVVCIDLWLASHPTCPVCRRAAMVLSQPNPSPPQPA